jgi:hypothetical protein
MEAMTATTRGQGTRTDESLGELTAVRQRFEASGDPRRHFVATYARTTAAVGAAIRAGRFEDPQWVDRWDARFAGLYLDALAASERDPGSAPRPWRAALGADSALRPLRHVLLGMNAHINFDLPQALLAVISDEDFADPGLLAMRRRDHEHIDEVLAERVAAEDRALASAESARPPRVSCPDAMRVRAYFGASGVGSGRSLADRVLTPVNRAATRRFLAESRRKVWFNAAALQAARRSGDEAYRRVLGELEVLSAARIVDLLAPGQVVLKLATGGFGVVLPPG